MTKHEADNGRADLSPQTNSVWLPSGTQRTVLIDDTPALFTDGNPVVVEVGFDPAGDVVAKIDGDVLGAFDAETSAELSPSLRLLETRGLVALAHGAFTTKGGEPAVTVHADPLGAPRARTAADNKHVPTDPFPVTEPFAADKAAEAAARAADESAGTPAGSTAVREAPRSRNMQAVAVLSSALAIGLVGLIGYYYGVVEHGREITSFINSNDKTSSSEKETSSTPATSTQSTSSTSPARSTIPTSSTSSTGATSSGDSPVQQSPAEPAAPAPAPAPGPGPAARPDAGNAPAPTHAPAPAPAPAPEPNPSPAPAPAPAPAPSGNGAAHDNDSGGGNAPQPRPIFELQW